MSSSHKVQVRHTKAPYLQFQLVALRHFSLLTGDGQSLSGYPQSSQAPRCLVLRVPGSSLAFRQTVAEAEHAL